MWRCCGGGSEGMGASCAALSEGINEAVGPAREIIDYGKREKKGASQPTNRNQPTNTAPTPPCQESLPSLSHPPPHTHTHTHMQSIQALICLSVYTSLPMTDKKGPPPTHGTDREKGVRACVHVRMQEAGATWAYRCLQVAPIHSLTHTHTDTNTQGGREAGRKDLTEKQWGGGR